MGGLVFAAVGFTAGGVWGNLVGGIATLISALAIIRQYKGSLPVEIVFQKSTWQEAQKGGFELVISGEKHNRGKNVQVAVYEGSPAKGYEAVLCAQSVDESGAVVIGATPAFEGKVVVK